MPCRKSGQWKQWFWIWYKQWHCTFSHTKTMTVTFSHRVYAFSVMLVVTADNSLSLSMAPVILDLAKMLAQDSTVPGPTYQDNCNRQASS